MNSPYVKNNDILSIFSKNKSNSTGVQCNTQNMIHYSFLIIEKSTLQSIFLYYCIMRHFLFFFWYHSNIIGAFIFITMITQQRKIELEQKFDIVIKMKQKRLKVCISAEIWHSSIDGAIKTKGKHQLDFRCHRCLCNRNIFIWQNCQWKKLLYSLINK